MRSHPPIFDRMTTRLPARHAANYLARALAHRERRAELQAQIRLIANYQRHPRFDTYREGRDE